MRLGLINLKGEDEDRPISAPDFLQQLRLPEVNLTPPSHLRQNESGFGDIARISTRKGILHLSAIQDVYSRRIVSWSMSSQQLTKLTVDALEMALARYPPAPGPTLHHDQGSQYRSLQYSAEAAKAKIALSMSRPGASYENAMIETFLANLKLEINDCRPLPSREAARMAIFEYIELFYNRARLHSALDYITPCISSSNINRPEAP